MTDEIKDKNEQSPIIDASTGGPLSKSRRRFLAHSGMYTAGLVGSALLGACSDDKNVALAQDGNDSMNGGMGGLNPDDPNVIVLPDGSPSDAGVLQFALNLEYLEAEYYLRAVTGSGLMEDDIGGGSEDPGMVTGGRMVDFSGEPLIGRYAAEIASDELDHVQFLRGGLGDGGVISRPQINFTDAFNAAAQAAGLNSFDPFASPINFLIGAFIFEDVGVSAYKGGAQFIRNRDFLTAAAGILSVEGYHAGLVRTILTARMDEQVGDTGLNIGQIVNAISDARDDLDGPDDIDQGIGDDNTSVSIYGSSIRSTNIVPVDDNGITYSRTPGQVHNIVYLTPNEAEMGGFFPQGTRIPANPGLSTSSDSGSGDMDDASDMDAGDDSDSMMMDEMETDNG